MSNRQVTNSARRTFLSMAVTGVVGAASAGRTHASTPDTPTADCGRLLVTDLLRQAVQRLDQVLSEVFATLYKSVAVSLDDCKQKYETLSGLAKQLEMDLRAMCEKRPATPQVQELQELTRAWRANLQLVSSALPLPASDSARVMLVAKAMNKQLCATAEGILPAGAGAKIELSEEAKTTLRSIIELVLSPDFQRIQGVVVQQNSYTEEARCDIVIKDRVRKSLLSAHNKMALAENPEAETFLKQWCAERDKPSEYSQPHVHTPGAPQVNANCSTGEPRVKAGCPADELCPPGQLDRMALRRSAVSCLRDAIDGLKELVLKGRRMNKSLSKLTPEELATFPNSFLDLTPLDIDQTQQGQGLGPEAKRPLTGLDTLLLSLSGLVRLICGSIPGGCNVGEGRPEAAPAAGAAVFLPVAARVGAPAPFNFRSDIIGALGRHCGDTSDVNVDACVANIRNVRTWPTGQASGLSWLTWLDMQKGTIHCVEGHNPDALVAELVRLI